MLAHASCVGVRAYLFRRRQKLGCGPGLGTRPRPPRCSARVTRPPRINTVPRVLGAASLASTSYLAASMMCGAPSAAKPATAETQKLVDAVKAQLEEKENQKYSVFKAVSYKNQVVAGTNYFVKVDVGEENFLHLRVFESLPHENKPPVLAAYQTNKSRHDELAYF